jgi:predicted outer membrane protein
MKVVALAVLVATAPLVAFAAGGSPDESFHKAAAEGGMSEVRLGNLAQERSSDAKVKDLRGDSFDRSYIESQVKAHTETVALLRKEIASG